MKKKDYYVFINKDGDSTAFHLIESTLISVAIEEIKLED